MEIFVVALLLGALYLVVKVWTIPDQLADLQDELTRRTAEQHKLRTELQLLRDQFAEFKEVSLAPATGFPTSTALLTVPPAVARTWKPAATPVAPEPPQVAPEPLAPVAATLPAPAVPAEPELAAAGEVAEELTPTVEATPTAEEELLTELLAPAAPTPETELAPEPSPATESVAAPQPEPLDEPALVPAPVEEPNLGPASNLPTEPVAAPEPAPNSEPEYATELAPLDEPEPVTAPEPTPAPADEPAPTWAPPPPRKPVLPRRPAPKPVPTGPTWWERASTVLLENWTGILGAVVLVTGVGFLGIYAALRVSPQLRFLMICAFAAGLLGARFALREKAFAQKLNAWLVSSAAAIFLFACVGSVSIEGLRWVSPPFDYLLLLAGVSANLYLAWRTSRQEVATLHGVLSLVALAVLPPTALTLGAAAGVTAFSIAITYRQHWKYQLLLSIVSFFAFHLYWHQELPALSNSLRLTAMALVLLVGGAAAVVQYRRVYAQRKFEPLLFTAHLLNWTCLGINLYLYSTGSVWKTIPLALGALLTFWAGRKAKQLGIGWLFQTDTIISLILALATALSLQGWHATPTVIGLFMLLETLLITLVMARQGELLVYRVALAVAVLASAGLLGLAGSHLGSPAAVLYREALVLALAGWAGLAFVQLILKQPLLRRAAPVGEGYQSARYLLYGFAGLTGLLQAGAGLGLARLLFGWSTAHVGFLLLGLAVGALALAGWVRRAGRAPSWVRWQQVALAQLLVGVAIVGLHEAGVSWSAVLLLLYTEALAVSLLLAGRAERDSLHQLVYRAALAEAAVAGLGVLLRASTHLGSSAAGFYREALVLTLAGWVTLAFVQLALKWPRLAGFKPYPTAGPAPAQLVSNHETHAGFLNGLAGLGGVLQAAAGLVLSCLLMGHLPTPPAGTLGALLAFAGSAWGLAAWVRTAGRAPGWMRWQQLVLTQFFVLLALIGLHKLGLNWSAVLLAAYLETLLVACALAGRAGGDGLHRLLYRAALAEAAAVGLGLLLQASSYLAHGTPTGRYREALVLAVAGWLSVAFGQLTLKWPLLAGVRPYLPRFAAAPALTTLVSNPADHRRWVAGFAGLGGGLQALAGFTLLRVLSEWAGAPVALLLGALLVLSGIALGLAGWVRRAGRLPGWVRWQQLVLAQIFVFSALFGLHNLGLNWSAVLLLTYVETLVVALLLAGRAASDFLHQQLYRVALAEAALVGLAVLLRTVSFLPHSGPAVLYREVLVVALAGWVSLAFAQLAFKWSLLAAIKPYVSPFFVGEEEFSLYLVSNPEENRSLVNCFAALGGVLQVVAGLGLERLLFGWPTTIPLVFGLLVALAASSVGLATWVRTAGRLPGWARWQQLVLAQGLVVLALAGLHEVGLGWSTVLLLVFGESLLVALLLAGRAAADRLHALVYRAALAQALSTGASLVVAVGSHVASAGLPMLYREALVLALAGWAALGFVQAAAKWPLLRGVQPYLSKNEFDALETPFPTQLVSNHEAHLDLLHSFAGLAGVLQAGAGLVLARVLFGWVGAPVAGLLGALGLLAGIALGLGLWLQATPALPKWMRRQQLVLTQAFAVITVFGLHQLGLSWPGVVGVLYAESLLVALLLSGCDEDDLLHVQTYLLVAQALVLPLLVRYTSLGALGLGARAALLVGAALLTLGYQARRLYWRRAQADFARLEVAGTPLPALGLAVGWLLLGAGSLVVGQPWAAWPAMALLGALLYLRQRVGLPGLWAGLMLAGVGYLGLQWHHVLAPHSTSYRAGYVLLYLLPTLAVPGAGLRTSWWPAGRRYVRWPWLYLLGAHLVVALVAAVPAGHVAYFLLGLLALGGAAFGAALAWRRALPDAAAVVRAGQPDRYLLHLGYSGLLGSLLLQGWLVVHHELLLGLRTDYLTAGLFVVVVAAVALGRPPAAEPVYASWRRLHPWLPEVALLFGSATLAHDVRTPWLPLVWVAVALLLGGAAPRLALRFRRLGLYGRLYYWLAAGTASVSCLLTITPSQLLSADWWALAAAVLLLFGYVGLALRQGRVLFADLAPAWNILALPARNQLETWLLYPAFMALAVLLIQSFDRSVLTVLLMLQVVAVFGGSLALRRQDLRYAALAGMLGCMARLLFFDLRQHGTVTRAIVFILMGLLLLGMNALYARFKSRFEPEIAAQPDLGEDDLVVEAE